MKIFCYSIAGMCFAAGLLNLFTGRYVMAGVTFVCASVNFLNGRRQRAH